MKPWSRRSSRTTCAATSRRSWGVSLAQGFLIEPPREVIGLIDVLETAADFGAVSPELLAWEFMVPESAVESVWSHALDARLLHPHGADADTGETMFALTARGKAFLRRLRTEHERHPRTR